MVRKVKWNGIFEELAKVTGTKSFTIRFSGRNEDMLALMEGCPENVQILKDKNSQNETANTTVQIPTVQSSEDLLKEIERILDEAFDDFENKQKKTKEFEWIMGLAKLGNTRAQYVLSEFYAVGIGTERDDKKSFEWAKTAAKNGDPNAQCNLGDIYFYGDCSLKEDMNQAFYWYNKAANQQCASAYGALGRCYFSGLGVKEDLSKAFKYLSLGYSNDELEARDKYNLACCFYEGLGTEINYEKAVEWYTESANQGNVSAMYDLAICYFYGKGVETNYQQAAELFTDAVNEGHVESMNFLGDCYYEGRGVTQNYPKAVSLFERALNEDSPQAYYNLGSCYRWGKGVRKDKEKAKELFKEGIELGSQNCKEAYEDMLKNADRIETAKKIGGTILSILAEVGGAYAQTAYNSNNYDE